MVWRLSCHSGKRCGKNTAMCYNIRTDYLKWLFSPTRMCFPYVYLSRLVLWGFVNSRHGHQPSYIFDCCSCLKLSWQELFFPVNFTNYPLAFCLVRSSRPADDQGENYTLIFITSLLVINSRSKSHPHRLPVLHACNEFLLPTFLQSIHQNNSCILL